MLDEYGLSGRITVFMTIFIIISKMMRCCWLEWMPRWF